MKTKINTRRFFFCRFFFSILFTLLFVFHVSAQDFRTVRDGIEYAEMTRGTKEEPVRINLLRLDLKKVRLDVVHALDSAIGLEKTSSIAARHGAFAAINAGFFRLDRSPFAGDAQSILMIDRKLLSESLNNRIALGIINGKRKTEVVFGHLGVKGYLGYFNNVSKKFDGINRERKKDEIILYTPEMKQTPATEIKTTEIIFTNCEFGCRRVEVVENNGGTQIPQNGYIVSVGETADKEYLVEFMKKRAGAELPEGAYVFKVFESADYKKKKKFEKAEDIVSGVPQLVRNKKIEITWEQEKAGKSLVETRHPRTAVARLKDGKFLMVTVDGRQPGYSVGMNLQELAALLLELGATDAINLDGGGSTTMFLDGKVVNKPSDKEGERSVGDAILVFPR